MVIYAIKLVNEKMGHLLCRHWKKKDLRSPVCRISCTSVVIIIIFHRDHTWVSNALSAMAPFNSKLVPPTWPPYYAKLIYSSKVSWPLRLHWITFPTHFNLQVPLTKISSVYLKWYCRGWEGNRAGRVGVLPDLNLIQGAVPLCYIQFQSAPRWVSGFLCIKFFFINYFYKNKIKCVHTMCSMEIKLLTRRTPHTVPLNSTLILLYTESMFGIEKWMKNFITHFFYLVGEGKVVEKFFVPCLVSGCFM